MKAMASQITSLMIVYSTGCLGADQSKHQSSALLAFVRGIHRSPVNSLHKGPVTWKMFPFDDVIMWSIFFITICMFDRCKIWYLASKQCFNIFSKREKKGTNDIAVIQARLSSNSSLLFRNICHIFLRILFNMFSCRLEASRFLGLFSVYSKPGTSPGSDVCC